MPIGSNIIAGASGQSTGYEIEQSLRLNDGDSARLKKSSASVDSKTWTLSFWMKPGVIPQASGDNTIFDLNVNGQEKSIRVGLGNGTNNELRIFWKPDSSNHYTGFINGEMRDPASWYHIVVVWDTTQSTESDRVKVYRNGEEPGFRTFGAYPSQNQDVAPADDITVGMYSWLGSVYSPFDGYIAEMHFIEGQALTPASFGKTNANTNQWQAIEYTGSYGTNGFYLKFQDSSALGDDSSGNTNDFTATNLAATDQVKDRPSNNFATMNLLDDPNSRASGSTFAEGNLKVTEVGGNARFTMIGNFGMSSGKWYFEFCGVNSDNTWMIGIGDITKAISRGYTGTSGDGLFIYVDGDTYTGSTNASYGTSWTYGDVIGVAVDMDNNALYFAKNNTWMNSGDPTSGSSKTGAAFTTELAGKTWAACMGRGSTANTIIGTFNFGQDSSFAGAKTSQGNGPDGTDLYYDPPSGYIPMCTAQLDDPSIADPTVHYNATTWSGDDSASRAITTGVDADFVWYKQRNGTEAHSLYDSIRGAQKRLISNYTGSGADIERTRSAGLQSFDSTGFTVGSDTECNGSGRNYIGWTWKAGGTASSNTDGSITSSVSANVTAGFSIVSFDGNGTSGATVGHGLSQAPELIIVKGRNLSGSSASAGWVVYSKPVGNTKYLYLNETDQEATDSGRWNNTTPTASVFTLGDDGVVNTSSSPYIAYCFHGVDGFSKVGSYTANGNNDGPFIYIGFQPAFFLVKKYASVGGDNWAIYDNKRNETNVMNTQIYPDSSSAEESSSARNIDFLSNGVKIRGTNSRTNDTSGYKFVYLAFAEFPFKTSNAR